MFRENTALAPGGSDKLIEQAAVSRGGTSADALLERLFAFAFRGLVYPQIWEDPICDMRGLDIGDGDHVVTIASGGCNALSYLTANPARVTAIDLNTAHVALNRMKLAALCHLPDYADFHRLFANGCDTRNVANYHRWIAPRLDQPSRDYWESRDYLGRQRITMFRRGFYKYGLLGHFIGLTHAIAKLHGFDPRELLRAQGKAHQREIFERRVVPMFGKPLIRLATQNPASLFGLGIPPAQYVKLAGDKRMADVLRERLEKLCCDFDFRDNYFAWQAFGRGYEPSATASLPPYLQETQFSQMRERCNRVEVVQANITGWLGMQGAQGINRYLLLDAQDWMTDGQLNALWSQIGRTAAPGARVLFRTADRPTLLPGRVAPDLLAQWEYRAATSADLTAQDRSSIYGGVHLYVRRS